jgi:hypothetical protein
MTVITSVWSLHDGFIVPIREVETPAKDPASRVSRGLREAAGPNTRKKKRTD